MKKLSFLFLIILSGALFVGSDGCSSSTTDPSEAELKKGQNADFTAIEGLVVGKWIEYYNGNQNHTKDKIGQPCYCVKVRTTNSQGANTEEIFKGVNVDKFKKLEVNQKLPFENFLDTEDLKKVEGKIIDKNTNFMENEFFIVVDDNIEIKVYKTTKELYYKKLDIGKTLPILN